MALRRARPRDEGGGVTNEEFGVFLDGLTAPATPDAPPYIGIDECVNSPVLDAAIVRLCNRGLASGAGPLWNQRRERADGEPLYVLGGLPRSWPASDLLDSKAVKYETWEDAKVVSYLLHHFYSRDRLVLLSADFRLNEGGLCSLLRSIAAPVLSERHRQRFSLTVLFKGRKIDIVQYAAQVTEFFEQREFAFGYTELRL